MIKKLLAFFGFKEKLWEKPLVSKTKMPAAAAIWMIKNSACPCCGDYLWNGIYTNYYCWNPECGALWDLHTIPGVNSLTYMGQCPDDWIEHCKRAKAEVASRGEKW